MLSILSKLWEYVKLLFSFWFIIHKDVNIEKKLLIQSDKVTKNDKLIFFGSFQKSFSINTLFINQIWSKNIEKV